jgi:hypothetical protein
MLTGGQRIVLVSQGDFPEDGPRPQVLVAYEDLNMALRATNVVTLIAREAGDILEMQISMWRFSCFNSPTLKKAAARHAQRADIIVVAPGNSSGVLPCEVIEWLERWTGRRHSRAGALVAVFDPRTEQQQSSVAFRQLQAAAGLSGMDFFCSAPDRCGPFALDQWKPPPQGDRPAPGIDQFQLCSAPSAASD